MYKCIMTKHAYDDRKVSATCKKNVNKIAKSA